MRDDRALGILEFSRPAPSLAAVYCCHCAVMPEMKPNCDEMSENARSEEAPGLNLLGVSDAVAPEWRDEVAAKLQQYRSRRKSRGPKYPSLQLPFERPEVLRPIVQEPASRSSLAVDREILDAQLPDEPLFFQDWRPELQHDPWRDLKDPSQAEASLPASATSTNVIEFPRYCTTAIDWDELAEPVIERPRIMEAPELVPPQPALGGILLEEPVEADSGADVEVKLRPASIQRRLVATVLDGLFVGSALAVGGLIFFRLTREIPPRPQLLIAAGVIPAIFWLSYQYLLSVVAGATLGQRACKLELVTFDASAPDLAQRRWRLLGSLLSAASLMLGYAWAFLDQDGLCWHDRISRTYLRSKS